MSFAQTELFDETPFWPIRRNLNTGCFTYMKALDALTNEMQNEEIGTLKNKFIAENKKEKEMIRDINSSIIPPKSRAMGGGKKQPPKKLFNINPKYRSKFL